MQAHMQDESLLNENLWNTLNYSKSFLYFSFKDDRKLVWKN